MPERQKYRERWVSALDSINVPFRFINGLADKVSGAHLVKRFRQICPQHSDVIELENVGHYPHFEAPAKVLEEYFVFRQKQ
jgi:pimeloyl-ACP methyl ester carboxylesterase